MSGGPQSTVLLEREGAIATVTLNRPAALNAITLELAKALELTLAQAAEGAGVILVRGAGRSFCAGGDVDAVAALRDEGPAALAELFAAFGRACALIATLPVPVVAVVRGHAMAGGFELMQACDIALVALDAKIADHHATFGQVPGGGGTQRLPRLVGRQRAAAHILSGDRLTGVEAVEWGLAYRAVPDAGLDAAARALAERLAARSPIAQATTKRLINEGLGLPLADGLALERAAVVEHLTGQAGAAGLAAFAAREATGRV